MAKFQITAPDGKTFEITAPEGATQDQVMAYAQSQWKAEPPKATPGQRALTSIPGRLLKGATDFVDAGAQYLPWALGAVTGGFGAAPNPVSEWLFNESDRVSKGITEREAAYGAARKATGQDGVDLARMVGNAAPTTLLTMLSGGSTLPATTAGRAGIGALLGGASAAMTPVPNATSQTLGAEKATQTAIGAGTGAIVTPVVGKLTDVIGKGLDKAANAVRSQFGGAPVNEQTIVERLRIEMGQQGIDFDQFPEAMRRRVAKDVADALRIGKVIDGVALARKLDMEQLGVVPTVGTITRDPTKWTREFNLRGVELSGDNPLVNIANQNRIALGEPFRKLGASTADDAYAAGNRLTDLLRRYDAPVKASVDASYREARDATGRYAGMNVAQFSKTANDALDEGQLGAFLPAEVRNILNGVSKGEIPLNVNTYTQMRQVLQGKAADMTRAGDTQGALAVRKVVEALDKTDIDSAAGEAAKRSFELARKAAAFRFGKQDAIPALKAVLDGSADPDKFVSKFVLNAGTDDLRELSKALPQDGREIVRAQIAKQLEGAAFGANITKDAPMATERYAKALESFGRRKLGFFFSPDEVEELYRVSRVSGYLAKPPAGATPNYSGTAAALGNLLQRIQGASLALPVVKQFTNERAVSNALTAQPAAKTVPVLSPALRDLLPLVPIGAGTVTADR